MSDIKIDDVKTSEKGEESKKNEKPEAPKPNSASVPEDADKDTEGLTLADVMASLYRAYPKIAAARQESPIASGLLTEAYGYYDTKLYGYTLSEPTGFYENYRQGIGVARQTWWGGYVSAGYRVGRGDFAPWYKERETDKSGEFKLSTSFPLLQGRAIDPQRLAVFQSSLALQAAQPLVQQAILTAARDAAMVYWMWVEAGAILQAQRELLQIAQTRGEQFEIGFKAGKFAEIDLILNSQLIAERNTKLLETEQKYRATSFKLSLYLRDEAGRRLVPSDDWLPTHFPAIVPQEGNYEQDLAAALLQRPEPRLLQLELRTIELDRQLACNQLLPRLDVVAEASQDMGEAASTSNDKGEFELLLGLQGEVPIQRRKARGKIQSTSAKMAQINEKLRLQRDTIGAELQNAYNALMIAAQVVEQAEISLRAAIESLDRYQFAFERGKIDLIYLNLLESKANETEIKLVEAQRVWFAALADMQLTLGLDPLDQAMKVSELPPSKRLGPGNIPHDTILKASDFDKDWKIHTTPPK